MRIPITQILKSALWTSVGCVPGLFCAWIGEYAVGWTVLNTALGAFIGFALSLPGVSGRRVAGATARLIIAYNLPVGWGESESDGGDGSQPRRTPPEPTGPGSPSPATPPPAPVPRTGASPRPSRGPGAWGCAVGVMTLMSAVPGIALVIAERRRAYQDGLPGPPSEESRKRMAEEIRRLQALQELDPIVVSTQLLPKPGERDGVELYLQAKLARLRDDPAADARAVRRLEKSLDYWRDRKKKRAAVSPVEVVAEGKMMAGAARFEFAWEVVAPADGGPGPRSRHGLVYDPAAKATILFGGIVFDNGWAVRADTWELRGGWWSRVDGGPQPPGRHRGAMVYHAARGNTVLFGGQAGSGRFLRDTWTYVRGRWRQWPAWWWAGRPAARCGHCMAFDEAAGEVVLFGGIGRGDRALGDTWLFDGTSWRPVTGPGPPARRYAAFAYDPGRKGCVLHGGAVDDHGHVMFGDAWLFRDGTWSRLGPGLDTEPRDDHGLAYHCSAGRLVMLEGVFGARGVLVGEAGGWQLAGAHPLHPLHQCSPLAWDETVGGLVSTAVRPGPAARNSRTPWP